MRIRVVQKPSLPSIDGIALDRFVPGHTYEVGNALGAYMLAEGWAEPVASDDAAVLTPLSEHAIGADADLPANVQREIFPPYYDGPPVLALDRRRRPRKRRSRLPR